MKKFTIVICIIPVLGFCQIKMTHQKWQEDLIFLHQKLEARHANLYHTISKDEFTQGINDLINMAGSINNREVIVRISELIAKVGDAHTWLHPGYQEKWKLKRLPVKFEYFEDGLFVVEANVKYKSLIGSKLIGINSNPVDQVVSKVGEIGYSENEFTRLISVSRFIVYPDVLKRFGFIEDVDTVDIKLKSSAGVKEISMRPITEEDIEWVSYLELKENLPLVYKSNDSIYWTEHNPDDKILYVQLNSIDEDKNHSFEVLSNEIIAQSNQLKTDKLVIDLRRNVGGNSGLVYPLIYALMNYEKHVPDGQIFVITSRWTLSASIVLCAEIQKYCNPIFIGEPTGAKANLYGENGVRLTLPNSRLSVSYSSEWFQPFGPFIDKDWIAPDIYVPIASQHYFNLEQPIIEVISAHKKPDQSISEKIFDLAVNDSMTKAVKLYREFKENPKNKYRDMANNLRRMARNLGRQGKLEYSRTFYELILEVYPNNTLILVNLAQLYEDLKQNDKAIALYEKTLLKLEDDRQTDNYLKHYIEDHIYERLEELN